MKNRMNNTELFGTGGAAPLVILNTFEGEGRKVYDEAVKLTDRLFTLAAVTVPDWNGDLSPWEIPPISKSIGGFTGGGQRYLDLLTGTIIPDIKAQLGSEPQYTAIAGYSLAGLFALWSLSRTDIFSRTASISGSLWYTGFEEYAVSTPMRVRPDRIYLSVGDRETNTKNRYMSTVESCTEALYRHYSHIGTDAEYELNKGDHFTDCAYRTAKGIAALLK